MPPRVRVAICLICLSWPSWAAAEGTNFRPREVGEIAPAPFQSVPTDAPLPINRTPANSTNGPLSAANTNASRLESDVLQTSFQEKSLTLAPPGKGKNHTEHSGTFAGFVSVAGSLAVVVGLFFVAMWLFKKGVPKGANVLSKDVLEVLGRAPLAGRQQLHLIRLGNKLLLVSATPGGVESLSEVTDPLEVDRLVGLCKQSQPNSISGSFKQMLQSFAHDKPAQRGTKTPPAEGRLFDVEVSDA